MIYVKEHLAFRGIQDCVSMLSKMLNRRYYRVELIILNIGVCYQQLYIISCLIQNFDREEIVIGNKE